MQGWALSSAALRCAGRRLAGVAVAAPAPAALATAALLAAPFLLARAGAALGSSLGPALDRPDIARALVLGLVLSGAAAGAALALAAPGPTAVGPQLTAAPVGRRASVAAMTLAPAAIGAMALVPGLLALTLSLAAKTPGGAGSGCALAAGVAAGALFGAALAESCLSLLRGATAGAAGLAVLAAVWLPAAALGGDPSGPLRPVARSVAGGSAAYGIGSAHLVLLVSLGVWLAVAPHRPPARTRDFRRRGVSVPASGVAAVATAAGKLFLRRPETRLSTCAGLAFGATGVAVGRLGGAPGPTVLYLGAGTAALAAALAPLAAAGFALEGRSLWCSAPIGRARLTAGASAAALALPVAVVLPIAALAAAWAGAALPALATQLLLALVLGAAALAAGALVPWQRDRPGDQLASFAAFGACTIVFSVTGGAVGERAVTAGLPGPFVALVLGLAALAIGGGAVGMRLGKQG